MSSVDISSRLLRVLIGADEQDWSASIADFSSSISSVDESGLLVIDATLIVSSVASNPESIDPYDNPARWRPGQTVRVQCRNNAGTGWVDHPHGRLFILEEPDFPVPGEGLTVSLGCRMAWHDTYEFDRDETGVEVGTALGCAAIATNLLVANEIPLGIISLGTWPYSLAFPEGKGANGSFIQQAGNIAHCNDFRYIYQNASGNIVSAPLNLSIAAPAITITLGSNEVTYTPTKVEGSPPELVRVAGPGAATEEVEQPIIDIVTVTGDREPYEYGGVLCPGEGLIGRTTTVIRWEVDADEVVHRTTVTEESPPTATAKDIAYTSRMSPCVPRVWKKTETIKGYDLTKRGRLTEVIENIRQPRFTFFPTRTNAAVMDLTEQNVTTYTYASDTDDTITQIVEQGHRMQYLIDESLRNGYVWNAPVLTMKLFREKKTTWENKGGDRWRRTETVRYPKTTKNSSPEASPKGSLTSGSSSTSSTGNEQPPKAEIWDGGSAIKDIEFTGEAAYTLPGGGSGRTRKRLYPIEYGFSDSQCELIAQKHIELIAGRHRAALIEFPVNETLLSQPPLFPVDVVMIDGSIRHYRIDGIAFGHSADRATAIGTGILVGTTAAPTLLEPNPPSIPITSVAILDGATPVYESSSPVVEMV